MKQGEPWIMQPFSSSALDLPFITNAHPGGASFLVVEAVWCWSAGAKGLQVGDGGGELAGPGPSRGDAQPYPPAAADQAPGGGGQP